MSTTGMLGQHAAHKERAMKLNRTLQNAGRRAQAGVLGRRLEDSFAVETLTSAVATVLGTEFEILLGARAGFLA